MLFDVKRDGRCKCRAVVAGHQRAIRRNVDYQTSDVYAPAPRLETGRALQAFACMYKLHRDAADCVQAYLIGTPSPDQHYPVRYPEGPIRDRHRDPDTNLERYAVAVGNVYGIPIAGRTWANERNRVLLLCPCASELRALARSRRPRPRSRRTIPTALPSLGHLGVGKAG